MKPLDVLLIARHDWANVAFHFANALNRVEVRAKAIKEFSHTFYKGNECEVVTSHEVFKQYLKAARSIVVVHSTKHKFLKQYPGILKQKFSAVFHGGKAYRQGARKLNRMYNPVVNVSLIQTYDLLGLGAKNEHWVTLPLDVKAIQPNYFSDGAYKIGHYPRDAKLKRSALINETLKRVNHSYRKGRPHPYSYETSTARLQWKKNLDRMRSCDIYVVSMSLVDNLGFPTAEWGYTAAEAAACGDVVLTAFKAKDEFEKEFGPCPMPRITSAEDLYRELRCALSMPESALKAEQVRYRRWAENTVSYEAVGERLKGLLKGGF